MTLRADYLVDRRKLKRSITVWRVLAVAAVFALLAALLLQNDQVAAALGYKPHIARVKVTGIIQEDRDREKMLKEIAESDNVKGVILRINSPGGTTVGGESLHKALIDLRKKKPVVAVFSTVATSAAYMAGIASDHIVARGGTITGSVGVILQWAEVSELLDKLGINMQQIKSGELKAVPSPFEPTGERGRQMTREMVTESKNWFVDLVAKSRSLDPYTIPGLTEGRIYSGREAIDLKLIDQIGGEDEAIAWLEEKRQVPGDLDVIDWDSAESNDRGWLFGATRFLLQKAGFSTSMLEILFGPGSALKRVQLDGLVSVWHVHEQR